MVRAEGLGVAKIGLVDVDAELTAARENALRVLDFEHRSRVMATQVAEVEALADGSAVSEELVNARKAAAADNLFLQSWHPPHYLFTAERGLE